MSDVIITPLMSLTNPVPGSDTGPDYATNLYNSLNIVDGHNHSAGSGNPINTNGILINADLPFNTTYNATLLRSARFAAQSSPLAGASDLGCLYVSGVDLWFNDVNGNQVRITSGAAVNATSSGISSGTASAAFSGGVLVVNSNTNTPANIQCGSVLIGNTTVSPNFVTVQAPTALGASYPFVLPTALPASQKFMTLDASGNTAAPWAVDNSTIEVSTGTTVQVKDSGIVTAKIADGSITTAKLAAASVTPPKLAALNIQVSATISVTQTSTGVVTNSSVSITTTGRPVLITLLPNTGSVGGLNITTTVTDARITLQLEKGGSNLTQFPLGIQLSGSTASSNRIANSSIYYVDQVAAGTYTYRLNLVFIASGTTMNISDLRLCAQEIA